MTVRAGRRRAPRAEVAWGQIACCRAEGSRVGHEGGGGLTGRTRCDVNGGRGKLLVLLSAWRALLRLLLGHVLPAELLVRGALRPCKRGL